MHLVDALLSDTLVFPRADVDLASFGLFLAYNKDVVPLLERVYLALLIDGGAWKSVKLDLPAHPV
jgi:hypothetical protein